MKWVVLVLFGGMGLGTLVAGLVWGAKRAALFRNGLPTHGKVVENYASCPVYEGEYQRVSYYPVVEFQTPNGETFRFKGSTGSSSPEFATGARVRLRYNPKDPSQAQLVGFFHFWLGPLALTIPGLLVFFLALGVFYILNDIEGGKSPAGRSIRARMLAARSDAIRIEGRIRDVRGKGKDKYVFVCEGLKPGASFEDEFESDEFDFNPGSEFSGRSVTICLDPSKKEDYGVDLGPLLEEIVEKQSR